MLRRLPSLSLRPRAPWLIAALCLAVLAGPFSGPLFVAPAEAQVRFVPESLPDSLSKWLEEGRQLESQARWGEALSHYEDALREHPGEARLQKRQELAQIHYDLSRRYSDESFRNALTRLGTAQALDLYSEVLLKINAHYVHSPDWQELIARGTRCLSVALESEEFRDRHLRHAEQRAIEDFRAAVHRQVAAWSIRSRNDAERAVSAICRMAQARLGLSPTAVVFEYVCGATGGLDDYSAYLTSDQLQELYAQIDGNFVGLGIELKADNGSLLLVHVIPGSPALRAGLKAGDRIVAVSGYSTAEMTTDEAAKLLQGEEGSWVEVSVVSPGREARTVNVRREHVDVPSVEKAKIVDADYGIAYFKLASFQKTTTRDVDAALWDLHRQGMRSLIIDLRGNPGGLLTSSVEVADKFLERGMIVSTRGRNTQEDFNYQAHRAGTWRVPLVVLIDGDSASASEIFAGAIRDNQRGVVVGSRSYGKGSVQGIFPLSAAGAGIRLTTAKFYSPGGRPISKVGVQPDIVVRHAARATSQASFSTTAEDDAALQAALQAARRQLASR